MSCSVEQRTLFWPTRYITSILMNPTKTQWTPWIKKNQNPTPKVSTRQEKINSNEDLAVIKLLLRIRGPKVGKSNRFYLVVIKLWHDFISNILSNEPYLLLHLGSDLSSAFCRNSRSLALHYIIPNMQTQTLDCIKSATKMEKIQLLCTGPTQHLQAKVSANLFQGCRVLCTTHKQVSCGWTTAKDLSSKRLT